MIWGIFTDTLIDSIKMLPFLLVAYFLIELLERKGSKQLELLLTKGGKYTFIPGALLGLIPQCGFSGMAANLYAGNVISLGTLIAVFISTSDEALPLLIASKGNINNISMLLVLKLIFALLAGFMVDLFNQKDSQPRIENIDCHDHNEEEGLIKATVRHTLHVFLFIFVTLFAMNLIITLIGEDRFKAIISGAGILQIFVSGLVGMIPSCASSVLLTQMYTNGQLSFAAMFSGLCTGAGMGTLVLIRTMQDKKKCLRILLLLYAIGVSCGLIVSLLR